MGIKAIIIAVVALAVVGGGAYYVANNNGEQQNTESQTSEQTSSEAESINELLAQGRNVECSFDSTEDNGDQISGTVYVAGERMRGNFTLQSSSEQTEYNSHVLQDGEYQYLWEEGSDTGFKLKLSSLQSGKTQKEDIKEQQTVDQDKEYNFNCSEWSVDESMFNTPDGVEFTDYSAQLEQAEQLQQNSTNQQQDVCASISDPSAREACESAY